MKYLPALIIVAFAVVGCSPKVTASATAPPGSDLANIKSDGDKPVDLMISRAKEMVKKAPSIAKGYSVLGQALMQRGRETGELQNYVDALAAFQKAVDIEPTSAEAQHNLAWGHTMFHRFDKAVEHAELAIKNDKSDAFAYGVLTDSYMETGKYDEAADSVQKMVDLRPDLSSLSRVSQVKWVLGDGKGATITMSKALRAGGPYAENTGWCQTQLGDIQWKMGATLAATQIYADVLKRLPSFKHALFGQARIKAGEGKLKEAEELLAKATEGNTPIPYLVAYGDVLLANGKKGEAEKQYSRVQPAVQEHLQFGISGDELNLIEYWLHRGIEKEQALSMAELEASHHSTWQVHSALAWAQHKNGQNGKAWKTIQKALEIKVQEAEIYYRAGTIANALGKAEESRKHLAMATNLNPDFDVFTRINAK